MEVQRNCTSCYDEKPENEFPHGRLTQHCEHDVIFTCTTCVAESISAQAHGKIYDNITCTETGCNARFAYGDVERWADRDTFDWYSRLATREAIQALPEFRWCAAGNCENGECYPDGDLNPQITCSNCGNVSCYRHQRLWHEGQNCDEFDRRAMADPTQSDAASIAMIEANTKRCPGTRDNSTRMCNSPIIKDKGCSHMTCPVCGSEFCWECFANWRHIEEQGNRGHNPGCRLWRDEGPESYVDYYPPEVRPTRRPVPRRPTDNRQSGRRQRRRLNDTIDLTDDGTGTIPDSSGADQRSRGQTDQTEPRRPVFVSSDTPVGHRIRALLQRPLPH